MSEIKFQRIEDMRCDHDKTIKEMAQFLQIHRDVYSRYEKGKRTWPVEYIIRLAKYYDCTTDYLLGISDDKGHFGKR